MGKSMWLAGALSLIVGGTACSLKRTTFTDINGEPADASQIGDTSAASDALAIADAPPRLGTQANPAAGCGQLKAAGLPSAAYWVHTPSTSATFEVYCDQEIDPGAGWAVLENSVRRDDGTTTPFWQFTYADRLGERGSLAPDQNYYNGALYLIGTEYMDVFVDLQDKTATAVRMTATGLDPETMTFTEPAFISGDNRVYSQQFAAGWAAQDYDNDRDVELNCATYYSNVAQHYGTCWYYSLGSDADIDTPDFTDGGVGPHVLNDILTPLGLALQPEGGRYSQVKRIARFTRWQESPAAIRGQQLDDQRASRRDSTIAPSGPHTTSSSIRTPNRSGK